MYKATMLYDFHPECFQKACELWEQIVFQKAVKQPGLVQMLLLANNPSALAIGIWENQSQAMAFMETGVFKDFIAASKEMIRQDPIPSQWKVLSCFP